MFKPTNLPEGFDRLEKGDVLHESDLRGLIGEDLDRYDYQHGLTQLQSALETRLDSIGKPFTVVCDHGDLRILTDAEAAKHNTAWFENYRRRLRKRHSLALSVDIRNLPRKDRPGFRRALEVQGATIAGMIAARKAVRRTPHKRLTPGIETYQTIEA